MHQYGSQNSVEVFLGFSFQKKNLLSPYYFLPHVMSSQPVAPKWNNGQDTFPPMNSPTHREQLSIGRPLMDRQPAKGPTNKSPPAANVAVAFCSNSTCGTWMQLGLHVDRIAAIDGYNSHWSVSVDISICHSWDVIPTVYQQTTLGSSFFSLSDDPSFSTMQISIIPSEYICLR